MKIGGREIRELLAGLRRRKERLGIDIDGRAVRIVRVDRRPEGTHAVTSFGELPIDLLHSSAVDRQRFKLTVRQLGGGLQCVALNAEHPSLRVRRMNFAKMPERDLIEAIRWNFREHIEGPIEKYIVGFTPLDEPSEDGRVPIIAYGLAMEAVDDYSKLMRSLGFKTVSLEPSASALLAAFNANGMLKDGKIHVCVCFGDATTIFSVMRNRSVLFCRPLPGVSNESLARLVMRNLSLDAEKAHKTVGLWMRGQSEPLPDDGLMRRIETTVGHFFSQMSIEMQRSIDAFCIMYGVERVDRISVCGMGTFYPGLVEHLRKTLGIATEVFNPFERLMDPSRQTPDVLRVAPMYAVAVGLAIP